MKTSVTVFPFDLFGSAGSSAGAQLLGDAVRELLADTRAETRPTRSHIFRDQVRLQEITFETLENFTHWRAAGRKLVRAARKKDDFNLFLAGNHLGVLPVYEEYGKDAVVIQLDAHLDIYNLSDCTEELSHGNFLLHNEEALPEIMNIGHRDLFLPSEHIQKHYLHTISALETIHSPEKTLKRVKQTVENQTVILDIDCDVFDPAYFPATTHPLPFGIAPSFVPALIETIGWDRLALVAISEFEPGRDRQDQSLNTLGWLLEWILLGKYEATAKNR